MYQDVPGICPGLYYQLNFFLSAVTDCGSDKVFVAMQFLDHHKNPLNTVLEILVPEDSLSNDSYACFINATWIPAPPGAAFARISFDAECDQCRNRAVHLDDVSLIAI
jgi:hypothetical protein